MDTTFARPQAMKGGVAVDPSAEQGPLVSDGRSGAPGSLGREAASG